MNNLIVGTPRSGTFNLYNSILANPDQTGESEPFFNTSVFNTNSYVSFEDFKLNLPKNNHCVKTISIQFPSNIDTTNCIEYYRELFSLFDNIILLDRKDTTDHYKSWCNLVSKIKKKGGTKHVNDPYIFKDNMVSLDEIEWFVLSKVTLHRVAQEFNKEVFYYEDLYFNDTKGTYERMNLNFTKFSAKYLDLNRKYRRNDFKRTLV